MSLATYLKLTRKPDGPGVVSETAFYEPLARHILGQILGYRASHRLITKRGEAGIPDVRLLSGEDKSEWVVCEAKLDDELIRNHAKRERVWREQIAGKHYIGPETVYVLLAAPRTFYVCDLDGKVRSGCELDEDGRQARLVPGGPVVEVTRKALREALGDISFESSLLRPQYEAFRKGELRGGHIQLTPDTLDQLHPVFTFAVRELKEHCRGALQRLRAQYPGLRRKLDELEADVEAAGSEERLKARAQSRLYRFRRKHSLVLRLFGEDYPQFKHDQTYAGTTGEKDFEDVFVTNTAHVALSRLLFVRICEDIGLTTRKISNGGIKAWRDFVENIKGRYQDLLEVAFKDVERFYSSVFEETVFDWYAQTDTGLHDLLERILFRLNAFSFKGVDREILGRVYQYFRPKAERKRLGEYYTPDEVVDYILHRTGIADDPDIMQKRILDPGCGSFTFGVRAAAALLRRGKDLSPRKKIELVQKCLVGCDINPFSVFLSHLSLLFTMLDVYLEAKAKDPEFELQGFTIANINSLTANPLGRKMVLAAPDEEPDPLERADYDYVIGNPPFVRNERVPKGDRPALQEIFARVRERNTDVAAFFFYSAVNWWLKEGEGVLGMLAPIGLANARMAKKLRAELAKHSVYEVVSLEWMAPDIFRGADIIPIVVFLRRQEPPRDHKVTVVSGLQSVADLVKASHDSAFHSAHSAEMEYDVWLGLSPTGDWPLEIREADVPIVEKLNASPPLKSVLDASFGVKVGPEASVVKPVAQPREAGGRVVPFGKGSHVYTFGVSGTDEVVDLDSISSAEDPSLWGDLSFYERARSQAGARPATLREQMATEEQPIDPSDTLCCAVPEVHPTLSPAVFDPLQVCFNNSVVVSVPLKYSAACTCALIGNTIARYYAFLVGRAGILLRRRATWYPRTLENLPLPALTKGAESRLHELVLQATELCRDLPLTQLDAFDREMAACKDVVKAGFLGVSLEPRAARVAADDLAAHRLAESAVELEGARILANDSATAVLMPFALMATEKEELSLEDVQDAALPSIPEERERLAEEMRRFQVALADKKAKVHEIEEEIDEVVVTGLGLTPKEHGTIKRRCAEFPLSVTVARPRYVWSPDRKLQPRRTYKEGERYK